MTFTVLNCLSPFCILLLYFIYHFFAISGLFICNFPPFLALVLLCVTYLQLFHSLFHHFQSFHSLFLPVSNHFFSIFWYFLIIIMLVCFSLFCYIEFEYLYVSVHLFCISLFFHISGLFNSCSIFCFIGSCYIVLLGFCFRQINSRVIGCVWPIVVSCT